MSKSRLLFVFSANQRKPDLLRLKLFDDESVTRPGLYTQLRNFIKCAQIASRGKHLFRFSIFLDRLEYRIRRVYHNLTICGPEPCKPGYK